MLLVRKLSLVLLLCLLPVNGFAADASPSKPDAAVKVDAKAAVKVDARASEKPAATPQPAKAPAVPVTVDEAVGTVQGIVKAFSGDRARAGIAGVLCLLIFIWRRFGAGFLIGKVPSKFLPLLTAGVAFLAALPLAIATDPWSWKAFIWQGLITGAEAMAFWSVVVKFIFPMPEAKK